LPTGALLIAATSLLWTAVGGAPMSAHGWIALVLGAGGVAVLAAVLMGLAFHSSRYGHDDRVGQPDENAPPRRLD
jgi:hypothetical protein